MQDSNGFVSDYYVRSRTPVLKSVQRKKTNRSYTKLKVQNYTSDQPRTYLIYLHLVHKRAASATCSLLNRNVTTPAQPIIKLHKKKRKRRRLLAGAARPDSFPWPPSYIRARAAWVPRLLSTLQPPTACGRTANQVSTRAFSQLPVVQTPKKDPKAGGPASHVARPAHLLDSC